MELLNAGRFVDDLFQDKVCSADAALLLLNEIWFLSVLVSTVLSHSIFSLSLLTYSSLVFMQCLIVSASYLFILTQHFLLFSCHLPLSSPPSFSLWSVFHFFSFSIFFLCTDTSSSHPPFCLILPLHIYYCSFPFSYSEVWPFLVVSHFIKCSPTVLSTLQA